MPFVMKRINIISRCASMYKTEKLGEAISGCYHSMILCVSRSPGLSQDEISHRLCLNKSTVARAVSYLEENGYVIRETDSNDKRIYRVYPTEKMNELALRVREVSAEWNRAVSKEVSEEDMIIFNSVLEKIERSARELAFGVEEK